MSPFRDPEVRPPLPPVRPLRQPLSPFIRYAIRGGLLLFVMFVVKMTIDGSPVAGLVVGSVFLIATVAIGVLQAKRIL